MDLVTAAVNLQSARYTSQVQLSVAKKILDVQNEDGGAALQLMTAASNNMDAASNALISVAQGLGDEVDTYA